MASAGGYSITGQDAGGKSALVASAWSYAISGGAAPLRPSLLAASGAYAITGSRKFVIVSGIVCGSCRCAS